MDPGPREGLGAIATMRHGEQLLIVRPRDGQKKCRFIDCFDLVLDRSAESQETPILQVVYLPLRLVTDGTLQHLHRACAICVMCLYRGGTFHTNQNNPKIRLFEKSPSINA